MTAENGDDQQGGGYPDRSTGEVATGTGLALVQLIPVVGGAAASLLGIALQPALDKRRVQFINSLANRVEELQGTFQELHWENLKDNPAFVTAATHATLIALVNHQQEKLDALRNAAINSALPDAPGDTLQSVFLRLVDELTPWHLEILRFWRAPHKWCEERGLSCPRIPGPEEQPEMNIGVQFLFRQVGLEEPLYSKFENDLLNAGLLERPSKVIVLKSLPYVHESDLGKRFIRFITGPDGDPNTGETPVPPDTESATEVAL